MKRRILCGLLTLAASVALSASMPHVGHGFQAKQMCYFEEGRSELNALCLAGLDRIVELWDHTRAVGHPWEKGPPRRMLIEIKGRAYDPGDEDFNLRLSWERARAVSSALLARGIDADRLQISGYGRAQPLYLSIPERAEEMNLNRHVEIIPR